jgi:hypothetical protein
MNERKTNVRSMSSQTKLAQSVSQFLGECGDYAGGQDEQPCLDVALSRADVPVADGLQPFQYLSDDRQDALWWRHSHQIAKQLVVVFDLALAMQ